MIGHIHPIRKKMPLEARREYAQIYCGVCKSLQKKYGITGTLVVNDEISLIVLALRNFFIPKVQTVPCPTKLYIGRACASQHSVFDEAAKYSIMLTKLKLEDSLRDEASLKSKFASFIFRNSIKRMERELTPEESDAAKLYSSSVVAHEGSYLHLKKDGEAFISTLIQGLADKTNASPDQVNQIIHVLTPLSGIILLADAFLDIREDLLNGSENFIVSSVAQSSDSYFEHLRTLRNYQLELIEHSYNLVEKGIVSRAFSYAMESAMLRLSLKLQQTHDASFSALNGKFKDAEFRTRLPFTTNLAFASNGDDVCDDCCNDACCNECCDCCDFR